LRKKQFLIAFLTLLIISIFILSGCIPLSEEAQITYLINRYYAAINQQNWEKAKSYCIFNSTPYNDVINIENKVAQWDSSIADITLDYSFYISDIIITGKYATVDGFLSFEININGSITEDSGEKTINVEKIDNNWQLY